MKHLLGVGARRLATTASLGLLLACDVPPVALYPLSRAPTDLRWEPQLLGTWVARDDSAPGQFVVRRTGYYRYSVTVRGPGGSGDFAAYLVPLEGAEFLDLTADVAPSPDETLLQPIHFVARIRFQGDTLWTGWAADTRWQEQVRRLGAPVVRAPGGLLLITVGTDSLRELLRQLVRDSTVSWHPWPLIHDPRWMQPPTGP